MRTFSGPIRLVHAHGEQISEEQIPEQSDIDYRFSLGSTPFVAEHTFIESWPNQIRSDRNTEQLLASLESRLQDKLPPGRFNLIVVGGTVGKIHNKLAVRQRIYDWIVSVAPGLEYPDEAPLHFKRETPEGVPFELTLSRWHEREQGGKFSVAAFSPDELEKLRRKRISAALTKKCPKLHAAKRKSGLSFLVLEWNDIATGIYEDIASAVVEELKNWEKQLPDYVYLVEMTIPYHPMVGIVKEKNSLYPTVQGQFDQIHFKAARVELSE